MERKIRILHITQAVGGGVERYIQMLLKCLDHTYYENYLLVSRETDTRVYESVADHIEQVDMHREIGLRDIRATIEVRKVIKRLQPDIIYAHSSKAGAIVRLANLGLNRLCLYNPHGWAFNMTGSTKKQKLYTVVERFLAPFCDKIICISDTEKKTAIQKRICREDKMVVIHNGIDIEKLLSKTDRKISRESLNISENAFVVGMVGRVAQQKAPDVFVEMAQKLLSHIPDAVFVIVGDGELRKQIESQIKELKLEDRFYITGWVNNPQDYVNLFDVAVLLSRWEGFGLVLPEYMLARKPIVASQVDAIPELIQDRVNGLLVPVENPVAASSAVYELYRDAQMRDRIVQQGVQDVYEKYDIRRVAKEHMELFGSMTK